MRIQFLHLIKPIVEFAPTEPYSLIPNTLQTNDQANPNAIKLQLDGKDIRYLTANELRNFFGVVPQETTLFSGTLYENEPFRRVSV